MVVGDDGVGCVLRLGIEGEIRYDRWPQRNHERPPAEEEIRGDESVINVYYATRSYSGAIADELVS